MAISSSKSLTGDGATVTASDPVPCNWRASDPNISVGFTSTGSSTTFTLQACLIDPSAATSSDWFDVEAFSGTSDFSKVIQPVQALRISANATGTDTGTLTVLQGN